ncbi:MAG: hypothetical protein ACLFP4_16465 [Spirochaetales bacterium]
MRNIVILALVFGIVGLVIGYLIFARAPLTGELIAVGDLLGQPRDLLGELVNDVLKIEQIRRNILLTGLGGVVVGIVLGAVMGRGRR